jgi:DNA-binding response OmpR family regulator
MSIDTREPSARAGRPEPAAPAGSPVALAHIALLDDEAEITTLLGNYLRGHGYRVTELRQGTALRALVQDDAPDLVLLDLGLPGEDGLAIARRLRETAGARPLGLIIVTGRGDAVDRIVGLEIGADDYVTKPFDLRELLARVKAVLRRLQAPPPAGTPAAEGNDSDTLHFAGFCLQRGQRRLLGADGNEIALTSGEFDLLLVFLTHPGRVLSRDFLLSHSRGRGAAPFDRTIDVQVGRLRRKLEPDPQQPQILKSARGAGYLLAVAVTAPR